MKKYILYFGLFVAHINGSAQTLNPTPSITNAGTADNFKGGYTFAYASSGTPWNGSLISFGGFNNNYDTQLSANYYGTNLSFRSRNGDNNTWNNWVELASKNSNNFVGNQTVIGSVGIGLSTATEPLHVNGNIRIGTANNNSWLFHAPDDTRRSLFIAPYNSDGTADWGKQIVLSGGNIAVRGRIEALEIKVTQSPTADFVFEESYDLPKLEDVERHIKEKKHLPEIASAKEMEKEGVNLGEFQIKLLQKIEELTLYSIEQNKQLRVQNEKIDSQNEQIKLQALEIDELKMFLKNKQDNPKPIFLRSH